MQFLVKIWIFELDFKTVLSFIIGLLLGMVLICLIYALLVVLSLRDKKYSVNVDPNNLSEEQAKNMILTAQESFKDKNLRGKLTKTQYFRRLTTDLVYGIASSFYPDSKYPLLEITIDEGIDLIGYVQKRLSDILDKKAIRLVKKIKVSTIVSISLSTKNVVDSKAFKVTKNVSTKATKIKKAIDFINPVNWFKRLVVDNAITIITNKLYLVSLGIIGEEAYKIYSKSAIKKDVAIDSNVDELIDSIDDELKEIGMDNNVNNTNNNNDTLRFKTKAYKCDFVKADYSSNYDLNYKFKEIVAVEEKDEEKEEK